MRNSNFLAQSSLIQSSNNRWFQSCLLEPIFNPSPRTKSQTFSSHKVSITSLLTLACKANRLSVSVLSEFFAVFDVNPTYAYFVLVLTILLIYLYKDEQPCFETLDAMFHRNHRNAGTIFHTLPLV